MELKEEIIKATIQAFNEKGIKFTMDDLAKILGMSKKTIYTVFSDKKELLSYMVDYVFDEIKEAEERVLSEAKGGTVDQIKAILSALPEGYRNVDFGQLHGLKDKYPVIYKKVENRLEGGWENTIELLEKGMKEGVIRNVSIPILKTMLSASLEQFFQRDILEKNNISYQTALEEVVEIIVNGIVIRE